MLLLLYLILAIINCNNKETSFMGEKQVIKGNGCLLLCDYL